MIALAIIFFVMVIGWRASKILQAYFEQVDYEKRRMFLMLAEELDRLDKAIKESEQTKQRPEIITPYKDLWHLRN